MGNDMFNDEQLAHAEIVQKETEDALGFWKDRALKAEAKLADKYLIEEQYETACGDRDGLLRMVETLREQKTALEAERDALLSRPAPPADAAYRPSDADLWKRTTRVLDRASKALSCDVGVGVRPAVAKQCDELRGAILSRPLPLPPECTHDPSLVCLRCRDFDVTTVLPPPADAAMEAVLAPIRGLRVTAAEIRAALESVLPYGPGQRDEAIVQTAAKAAADALAALYTPAPAPSAKEKRT